MANTVITRAKEINKRLKEIQQELNNNVSTTGSMYNVGQIAALQNERKKLQDELATISDQAAAEADTQQRRNESGVTQAESTQAESTQAESTQAESTQAESTQANEAKYKDAYNRIKAGKASNEDLLLFKDFTTEKLKETGFGPRSIDAIQRAAKGDFSNKPVTVQEPLPQNKPEGNSSTTTATQKHEPGIADQINAEKGIDSVSGGKDLNGDGHYDLQDAKIAMEKAKVAYDEATREYNRLKDMQPKAKIKAIPGSGMSGQLGQKQGR